MMELPGRQRSLTITSAVWIKCTNVTLTDRHADRRTDGHGATAKTALIYGVELLRAVTFCTEIEYVKRNLLVGLGH